jgi:hypothetical protein
MMKNHKYSNEYVKKAQATLLKHAKGEFHRQPDPSSFRKMEGIDSETVAM